MLMPIYISYQCTVFNKKKIGTLCVCWRRLGTKTLMFWGLLLLGYGVMKTAP